MSICFEAVVSPRSVCIYVCVCVSVCVNICVNVV